MTVELSSAKVEIVDKITWGQKEAINAAMLSGFQMTTGQARKLSAQPGTGQDEDTPINVSGEALLAAKYKAIEVCVVKITEGEKDVTFSREWLDNLSPEDGDKLHQAVDAVTKPAKKA